MAGGRPLESVLVAPGVKGKKVLAFKRDGLKKNEAVTGLIHDIVASSSARSAFHVLDLAKVVDLYAGWRRALPGVRPFYAVKCNPDTALLGALAALSAGFDCASRAEIEAVLALGVPPAAIVYANPCKPGAHVAFAARPASTSPRTIPRRRWPRRGDVREYWIDDGVYGSLNCILLDSYLPRPRPLAGARPGEETHASTVFGPTCDSINTVVTGYQLPEMSVDDWLVFDDMGAYTTAAGSSFNGFATSAINIYLAYSS
uniref:Orn/DAP/Arg decarboxylase 2 N-terminal domain-containing protein n=1 Tax=Oryza barthii TaxID=65489 RepID=A0A0D3FS81_9ORYZ